MKKTITWRTFLNILERTHIDGLSYSAKQMIFTTFSSMDLSTEEVYSIINGARKKEILSAKDKSFVRLNLVKVVRESFKKSDVELFKRLDEIDQIFKRYFRQNNIKQKDYTDGLRDCWTLAKRINKDVNTEALEFSKEELDTFEILAIIYSSVAEHVKNEPITAKVREIDSQTGEFVKDNKTNRYKVVEKEFVRIADYIVSTRIAELKNSTLLKLTRETALEFDGFLRSITSTAEDNVKDAFSKDEVKNLLDKTISLINFVSAEKYNSIRNYLNAYFSTIVEQESAKKGSENYEEFSRLTAKNILMKCSTLFTVVPENVGFSLDFLMGKTMEESVKVYNDLSTSKTTESEKSAELLTKYYPNLQLKDMDIDSHLYLAKQGPSHILVLIPSSIYNMTNTLVDSFLLGFGEDIEGMTIYRKKALLKEKGFDVDSIYTKDNLFEIFNNSVIKNLNMKDSKYVNNIVKNINVLRTYLSEKDVHKIVSHNFNLLLIENETLLELLDEIKVKSNQDNKKFVELFHEFINNKYVVKERTQTEGMPRVTTSKANSNKSEEMALPDKDYINVEILGLFDDVEEVKDVPEKSFSELYSELCEELTQITRYACCETKQDLEVESIHFTSNSVANIMAKLQISYSKVLTHKFNKSLQMLTEKLNLISTYDEFDEKDAEYILSLIAELKIALALRTEKAEAELLRTDKEISTKTTKERDKKSRKNVKEYDDVLKKFEELKNSSLLRRRYDKLVNQAEVDELVLEKEIAELENEEIHKFRDKELRPLLETSLSLRTEKEFIEKLLANLDGVAFDKQETKEEIVAEQINEHEIRARLDYLYEQRDLKIKTIKTKFNKRLKNTNCSFDDLNSISIDNPYGKRLLTQLKNIVLEIEELEAKLSSVSI